ncbi:MAG: phosphate ABC transporter substrate-binding protein [Candidatus Eremiobacteraeota bacterium]|nr:phosphate ABC transporter substrate-binding protein [Candidatus Eremiobacteraeota bacterium]
MLRTYALTLAFAGMIASLAACGGGNSSSSSTTGTTAESAGDITVGGSTALLPLVKQAAVDYQTKNPSVKISVSGGGSRVGITQAAQGGFQIGDSDIPAPGEPGLVDHKVAVVSFGVVVNPKAGVKDLTTQQVRDVFTGKVTNWKQVGGADQPITIVNRPSSSGTRAVFVKTLMGGTQPSASGLTQDSSGTVATIVGQTAGATSYLAMGYMRPGSVVAVSVDGVSPSDANVISGKYKYWSYEHMFTKGQPSKPVAAFIAFVTHDTPLLNQLHFIPVPAMKGLRISAAIRIRKSVGNYRSVGSGSDGLFAMSG